MENPNQPTHTHTHIYCNALNPHRVRAVIIKNFRNKRTEFSLKLDYTQAKSLINRSVEANTTHIYSFQQLNGHTPEYTAQRVIHPEYTTKHTSKVYNNFTSLILQKTLTYQMVGSHGLTYLSLIHI